jgi:hypothetical protein
MDIAFYLKEGIWHILDFQALDHMLFVVTLCCVYQFKDVKKILILLTAFTLGHSLTLILSGLNILRINQELVETLIPITIIFAAVTNLLGLGKTSKYQKLKYFAAAFFGLIHGAGFSNYFRMMLEGIEDSLLMPLLGFNIGIEIGQIIILSVYLMVLFILLRVLKDSLSDVTKVISGIAIYESLCILFL